MSVINLSDHVRVYLSIYGYRLSNLLCLNFLKYNFLGVCIRLRCAGHVARMEEGRSAFKILTGKPTGKRPLGRPRRR